MLITENAVEGIHDLIDNYPKIIYLSIVKEKYQKNLINFKKGIK